MPNLVNDHVEPAARRFGEVSRKVRNEEQLRAAQVEALVAIAKGLGAVANELDALGQEVGVESIEPLVS
jgi:hypothetical protein